MTESYIAFISYSHANRKFAAWLQRALESYTLPADIARRVNDGSRRLGSVFRDEAELPASGDLSQTLRASLAHSRNLIVVCSKEARDSEWVKAEIEEFRRLGKADRIFCCIADGGPPDCFPKAVYLTPEAEPLAADARGGRLARRNAVPKLAAALLDLDLNELEQRETRRRFRRLAAVTTASVAGLITMSFLTWSAMVSRESAEVARQNAEFRRLQAEELIGFMLGNLHGQLDEIGKLDLLIEVGDQASKYFAAIPADMLTTKDRVLRAKAMQRIGDVRFRLGNYAPAKQAFQASLEETQSLYAAEPGNTSRLFELSQAHYWVGFAGWYAGDLATAVHHWNQYLENARTLVAADESNEDWQLELAYAYSNLGVLMQDQQDHDGALEHFRFSVEIFDELATTHENLEYKYEVAGSLSWIGAVHRDRGELRESLDIYHQENELLNTLSETRENAHWQFSLAVNHGHLAELYVDLGELKRAHEHIGASLAITGTLLELDVRNKNWRAGHIGHLLQRAELLQYEGLSPTSLLEQAERELTAGAATTSHSLRWQLLEAEYHLLNMREHSRTGDIKTAKISANKIAQLEDAVHTNNNLVRKAKRHVAMAELQKIEWLPASDRPLAAQRILNILENGPQPITNPDLFLIKFLAKKYLISELDQDRPLLDEHYNHPLLASGPDQ